MNEKEKRGFIIVMIILGVAVVSLLALLAVGLLGKESNQSSGKNVSSVSGTIEKGDDEEGSKLDNEVEKEETTGDDYEIVIDGFQITVPMTYGCYYDEDMGPVVYLDDVFYQKTQIVEGSYEEALENPNFLTEKTIAAGGEILQDVKETELNGKKYAYFRIMLDDAESFVIHTQAADTNMRIAGQLLVLSDNLSDEDLLNVFAEIAETAKVTDAPNTTAEDLAKQSRIAGMGGAKSESTLSYGGSSITFQVEDGFYAQSVYDAEDYQTEEFVTEGYTASVDCYYM